MNQAETLQIRCLGGLSTNLGARPLSGFHSSKAQALLCYLAVTRRAHSRSALAGLFWPDLPETNARANLRKVLSNLRTLVGPYLTISRHGVSINLQAALWLDVAIFEEATARVASPEQLNAAVSLYQGDFLVGFDLNGAPVFEQWSLSQRARLRELAVQALKRLHAHHVASQDFVTAIRHLGQLLMIEPWREEAHRQLIRLLAQTGQRSAALRQFETCRQLLRDELGVEPSGATQALYDEIANDQLDQTTPTTSSLELDLYAPTASHPSQSLPAQTSAFVGRDQELSVLRGLIADPEVRLITVVGPGGIGKTRLAVAAVAEQLGSGAERPTFPHGVFFVSLTRLESPDLLVPAIAEVLGLHFAGGSDPQEQLLRFLRHRRLLLVLDNIEHLLGGATLVDEILRAAPGTVLLVTSRTRLNRQAEHLFPLNGLTYPAADAVTGDSVPADIAAYGALQLFDQCGRRRKPDFALTAANLPAILDICHLVDGMPLGIVLAAAWLDTLAPDEIAREIRHDLDFLSVDMPDLPRRQRSLRAAFDRSWRLLSKREQEIVLQLSLFRGGFTHDAARTVAQAELRDLQALVAKSLLARTAAGRYEIHELLRQFAAERLASSPQKEASVSERHCRYYGALLEQHTTSWTSSRQLQALAEITRESDNAQLAWNWAVKHRDWLLLHSALDSWCSYYAWRGRYRDAERLCQDLIRAIKEEGSTNSDAALSLQLFAKALYWQGRFSFSRNAALRCLQEAMAVLQGEALQQQDMRLQEAVVHLRMGRTLYSVDRNQARQHLHKSLALFQELKLDWGTAQTLSDVGHLDFATGNYPSALAKSRTALAMHEARGDRRAQMHEVTSLAWVQQHLGNLRDAELLRRQAVDLCEQLSDRSSLAGYCAELAYNLAWQGKFEEAHRWAEKGLAICLEDGRGDSEGFVRLLYAWPVLFSGDYEQARRELTCSLSRVRETNRYGVEGTVCWALACLALVEGAYGDAQELLEESLQLYSQVGDQYVGLALSGLGYLACLENDLPRAKRQLAAALDFAMRLKDYMFLVVTLPGVALYFSRAGQPQLALAVWVRARDEPPLKSSQWHRDVAGREVEAIVLPDGPVAPPTQPRLAPDLWSVAEQLLVELQDATPNDKSGLAPSIFSPAPL
jgi:predicted ATPase/DNA-binding SARP family transcriptional activator